MQYEPAIGRYGDSGPASSPMIKSAKDGEEEEQSTRSLNCLPSPCGGSS